jgi:hypothetical protein
LLDLNLEILFLLPPCNQIALNALFKGKIGGSRVAAKMHIWTFSEYSDTIFDFFRTNLVFFRTISEYSGSIFE